MRGHKWKGGFQKPLTKHILYYYNVVIKISFYGSHREISPNSLGENTFLCEVGIK